MIFLKRLLTSAILLSQILCWVNFRPDPTKIQAQRLAPYRSATAMPPGTTSNFSFTFAQSFSVIPKLYHTVCGFHLSNTHTIEYTVLHTGTSQTNGLFSLQIGATTQLYQFSINAIAFDFSEPTVGSISFTLSHCVGRTLPASCLEIITLPYKSPPVILYALTAVYLTNDFVGQPAGTSLEYSFQVGRVEAGATSYLYAYLGSTTTVYNFTYEYFKSPSTTTTTNYNLNFSTYQQFNNNVVKTFASPYSTGELMNNQSAVIGLSGINFDSSNYLNFNAFFPDQLKAKVTIQQPSASLVIIDFFVLAAPFCPPPYYLSATPQANCWSCDPQICLTCFNNLCASCDSTKFLQITDPVNLAGVCWCKFGTANVNGVCLQCNSQCLSCEGSVQNCTKCQEGYVMQFGRCVEMCYMKGPVEACTVECPQGCKFCQISNVCLQAECPGPSLYYNQTCVMVCPMGTYADYYRCLACSEMCVTCTDYKTCLTCAERYYVEADGFCWNCDPSCLTCSGPNNQSCTTCMYGTVTNGKCTSYHPLICQVGYFANGSTCSLCPVGCESCSSIGCLSCSPQYFLTNNSCADCMAVSGLKIVNGFCLQNCGDGRKLYAQCDDGNTFDGDGCSSNCFIQNGFFCEINPQINFGDVCYKSGIPLGAKVSRSLIANKIRFYLHVDITNLHEVQLVCWEPNYPFKQIDIFNLQQQVFPQKVVLTLDFHTNIQNSTCQINITKRLSVNFTIRTSLPLYPIPFDASSLNPLICFLKALITLTLVIVFFFHGIIPCLTATFICHVCLFIVSLLDYRGTPLTLYMLAPALSWIAFVPRSLFKENQFEASSILKMEDNLGTSWPLWLLLLINIILTGIVRFLRKRMSKRMTLLFRWCLREPCRFIHCSFFAYEPILLMRVILMAKEKIEGVNIAILIIFFLLEAGSLMILFKITKQKPKIAQANDGPLIRVYVYLYTMFIVKYYATPYQIGPSVLILTTICICIARTYHIIKHLQFKRKYEQLKSQSVSSVDSQSHLHTRIPYKTLRTRLILSQLFLCDLFFILNNTLILYMSWRTSPTFDQQLVVAIIKLTIFVIFILANLVMILWLGVAKFREIFQQHTNRIYPKRSPQRDISELKDTNQQWRERRIQIKRDRRYSFSSDLRVTKATVSSDASLELRLP